MPCLKQKHGYYLAQTEENLTKEIASRDAEQEVKERSDKAKDI